MNSFPRRSALAVSAVAAAFALGACQNATTAPNAAPAASPAVASSPASKTTTAAVSADALATLTYASDPAPIAALDRTIAAAGHDTAKLAPIAARLLAILRDSAAPYAARQVAAQKLGEFPAALVLTDATRPVFAAQLRDESLANLARLALAHSPGADVDALFLAALDQPAGPARLAVIQTLGNRRVAAATEKLSPLLSDADATVAAAAAVALGQIGTPASLAALAAQSPASPAIVEAELAAADRLGGDAAVAVYTRLVADTSAPAALRHAALHQLLVAQPAQAAARIGDTLAGTDAAAKAVAIEAVATLDAPGLIEKLGAQLPALDAPTQVAVLAALGRKGDSAAVPAISAAAAHSDATVRAAALEALGLLPGTPDVVHLLAGVIAGGSADDAKLAKASLARLSGPGVAAAIHAGAAAGDTKQRAIYLEQFALRNTTEELPFLLGLRAEPDAAVRSAALSALADLAPGSAQADILAWARTASDSAEQGRALRALADVSLRIPDVATRAKLVTDAIEQSPATVALRLLPVLPRIGGEASAASAARLALRDDHSLATAAVAALGRWGDSTGLDALIGVAEHTADAALRRAAVAGAQRLLERDRALPSARLGALVSRLLATADDAAVRARLVRLLGRCDDDASLAAAVKLSSDPVLATEASDAALAIRARRLGPPVATASAGWTANLLDGNPKSFWAVPATADQWIQIDFLATRAVHQLTFDQSTHADLYPEHLEVYVSDDPQHPGAVRASADGQTGRTVVTLPDGARGRYLIIRNTVERRHGWWGAGELLID